MISDIEHSSGNYVGAIYLQVADGTNGIWIYYSRQQNELRYQDSNDGTYTVLKNNHPEGTWGNKIEIYSDRYKVIMDSYDSGWVYDSVFSSTPTLTVEIFIKLAGDYPSYYWRAGYDNVIVQGIQCIEDITPPIWKNQQQEKNKINPGESIELSAQGMDDTAMAWAWLATNETGEWQSYIGNNNWYNLNWNYRKEIVINHNKVDEDLENFPVLISYTSSDLTKAQPDGEDIIFVSEDNIKYNHEIELFNHSNGELVAWVNISTLDSNQDTLLYMYYGNSACSSQQTPESVWDSHYLFVSHMSSTGTVIYDSTSNRNDGTKDGFNAPEEVDGKIGKCQDFEKDNSEHIVLDNRIAGLPAYTIEAWEKTETLTTEGVHVMATMYGSSGLGDMAWRHQISNIRGWNTDVWGDTGGIGGTWTENSPPVAIGVWEYYVGVWTGSQLYVYINSTKESVDETATGAMSDHVNMKTTLGGLDFAYGCFYDGLMDEVRISNVARSNAWISASYNTMSSPDTFTNIGNEQVLIAGGVYNSPMKMQENNEWQWSNFSWQNASIPFGTTVGWRIFYMDTSGNINKTDVMSFKIIIPAVFAVDGGEAVWMSTDQGFNWTLVNPEYDNNNAKAMISDSDGNLYIVTAISEIVKSTDQGENWTVINSDYNGDEAKSDWLVMTYSKSNDYLYIIEKNGDDVWRSTDEGITWEKVNDNYNGDVNPSPKGAATDSSGNLFVVDGNADVWKSVDNGVSWTKINDDYNGPRNNFAEDYVIGNDVHYIVMGVGGASYVYKSTDGGYNFEDMGKVTQYGAAEALAFSEDNLFAVINYGNKAPDVHCSDDGAISWSLTGTITTSYNIISMTAIN
jgi:hypothetical protein